MEAGPWKGYISVPVNHSNIDRQGEGLQGPPFSNRKLIKLFPFSLLPSSCLYLSLFPASASLVLGFQMCSTTPGGKTSFVYKVICLGYFVTEEGTRQAQNHSPFLSCTRTLLCWSLTCSLLRSLTLVCENTHLKNKESPRQLVGLAFQSAVYLSFLFAMQKCIRSLNYFHNPRGGRAPFFFLSCWSFRGAGTPCTPGLRVLSLTRSLCPTPPKPWCNRF